MSLCDFCIDLCVFVYLFHSGGFVALRPKWGGRLGAKQPNPLHPFITPFSIPRLLVIVVITLTAVNTTIITSAQSNRKKWPQKPGAKMRGVFVVKSRGFFEWSIFFWIAGVFESSLPINDCAQIQYLGKEKRARRPKIILFSSATFIFAHPYFTP